MAERAGGGDDRSRFGRNPRPWRHRRRRKGKNRGVERLGPLLEGWLERKQMVEPMRIHRIVERWAELVGERVAARSRPTRLDRGCLTITVASSAWLNELTFIKATLREQINTAFPGEPIARVRLVAGEVPRSPDGEPSEGAAGHHGDDDDDARPRRDPAQVLEALAPLRQTIAGEPLEAPLRQAIERARLAQLAEEDDAKD